MLVLGKILIVRSLVDAFHEDNQYLSPTYPPNYVHLESSPIHHLNLGEYGMSKGNSISYKILHVQVLSSTHSHRSTSPKITNTAIRQISSPRIAILGAYPADLTLACVKMASKFESNKSWGMR